MTTSNNKQPKTQGKRWQKPQLRKFTSLLRVVQGPPPVKGEPRPAEGFDFYTPESG